MFHKVWVQSAASTPTYLVMMGIVPFMTDAPSEYRWLFKLIWFGCLAFGVWELGSSIPNRRLRFTEGALIFSRRSIRADEVSRIVIKSTRRFTIHYRRRKIPTVVLLNALYEGENRGALRELREWAHRNHVACIEEKNSRTFDLG